MQAEVLAEYPDLMTHVYFTKLSPNVKVMFLPYDNPFIFPLPDDIASYGENVDIFPTDK